MKSLSYQKKDLPEKEHNWSHRKDTDCLHSLKTNLINLNLNKYTSKQWSELKNSSYITTNYISLLDHK